MANQNITFTLGAATIRRVVETSFSLPLATLFPGGLPAPEGGSVPPGQPAASEQVTLSVHTWVVDWHGRTILIDTGIGNGKDRPFSALFHQLDTPFLERLAEIGVVPDTVDYVLHTHLHTDHVGWNTRFLDGRWRPTFPNAKYVFALGERTFYDTPAGAGRRMVFQDSVLPVIEAGQAIVLPETGGEIADGFVFRPSPGHSAGHMTIALQAGGREALFTGDILHHPLQVSHPEWNSVFCLDPVQARASRRRLLDDSAGRDVLLFPAHFPGPSAGRVTSGPDGRVWNDASGAG